MLRFDKAKTFSSIRKSVLFASFKANMCSLDVLLFSELINVVSIFIMI